MLPAGVWFGGVRNKYTATSAAVPGMSLFVGGMGTEEKQEDAY